MTKEELIYTFALGDGHIAQNRLEILHKAAHEEYLDWKIQLLSAMGIRTRKFKVSNNGYPAFKFYTQAHNWIGKLRRILYRDREKNYEMFANTLKDWKLAILYMDDGSISSTNKKAVLTISTCVNKDTNQYLIDAIKCKFDVSFGQRKMGNKYALICGTREARKFMTIVSPTVSQVKCMHYKLKVKNDSFVMDV